MTEAGVAGSDKTRATIARMVNDLISADEQIVAILPFTHTRKRPKAPGEGRKDKLRTGVYQSWRRYRPLLLTNRRLVVFETGRTPHPREILAVFKNSEVELVDVNAGSFGASRFVLELPGIGRVLFEAGRRDQADLTVLQETLGAGAP